MKMENPLAKVDICITGPLCQNFYHSGLHPSTKNGTEKEGLFWQSKEKSVEDFLDFIKSTLLCDLPKRELHGFTLENDSLVVHLLCEKNKQLIPNLVALARFQSPANEKVFEINTVYVKKFVSTSNATEEQQVHQEMDLFEQRSKAGLQPLHGETKEKEETVHRLSKVVIKIILTPLNDQKSQTIKQILFTKLKENNYWVVRIRDGSVYVTAVKAEHSSNFHALNRLCNELTRLEIVEDMDVEEYEILCFDNVEEYDRHCSEAEENERMVIEENNLDIPEAVAAMPPVLADIVIKQELTATSSTAAAIKQEIGEERRGRKRKRSADKNVKEASKPTFEKVFQLYGTGSNKPKKSELVRLHEMQLEMDGSLLSVDFLVKSYNVFLADGKVKQAQNVVERITKLVKEKTDFTTDGVSKFALKCDDDSVKLLFSQVTLALNSKQEINSNVELFKGVFEQLHLMVKRLTEKTKITMKTNALATRAVDVMKSLVDRLPQKPITQLNLWVDAYIGKSEIMIKQHETGIKRLNKIKKHSTKELENYGVFYFAAEALHCWYSTNDTKKAEKMRKTILEILKKPVFGNKAQQKNHLKRWENYNVEEEPPRKRQKREK